MIVNVAGVDPGLVHTGVVQLKIIPSSRTYQVTHRLVDGLDVAEVAKFLKLEPPQEVIIEAYKPRSHFQNDARMGEAITLMKQQIPRSRTLVNTGVKQQVKPDLMRALGMWRYSTTSHHQDLRSAARILLFGMMKDTEKNNLLSNMIRDHIDGVPWTRI